MVTVFFAIFISRTYENHSIEINGISGGKLKFGVVLLGLTENDRIKTKK